MAQGVEIVAAARSQIGVGYEMARDGHGYRHDVGKMWGGSLDCSGLAGYSVRTVRPEFPLGHADAQFRACRQVSIGEAKATAGALLFKASGSPSTSRPHSIRHVAVSTGNGTVVEAIRPAVVERSADQTWTHAGVPWLKPDGIPATKEATKQHQEAHESSSTTALLAVGVILYLLLAKG